MKAKVILVVDDDPYVRDTYDSVLSSEGFVVETCSNPKDALEIFQRTPDRYGLIIIDIVFSEKAIGYLASHQISCIKTQNPPAIIGITAVPSAYDYDTRSLYGMHDVLLKPVHPNLLINTARTHIND